MNSNFSKGFGVLHILIAIGVVIIIGGVVFFGVQRQKEKTQDLQKQAGEAQEVTIPNNQTKNEISTNEEVKQTAKTETPTTKDQNELLGLSPKEVYLKIITDLEKVKTFDEWNAVGRKYSDEETNQINEAIFNKMTLEEKSSLFNFVRVFLPTKANIKDMKQEIVGNKATLEISMLDGKTIIKANMVLENGVWKIHQDDSKNPLITPNP